MAMMSIPLALRIVGIVLLSAGVCFAAGNEKEVELKRALEDVKATVHLVGEKAAMAATVLAQLQAQSEAFKAEIQEERSRVGAVTLRQALQVRRIDSNLRLLQQAAGYSVQMENRLAYFRWAASRLNAYREQIRDDLLLLRALDTVDSSALLRQIREEVEAIRRQCAAPILNAASSDGRRDLELLWKDIVKGT
jgi:hypothetical protein